MIPLLVLLWLMLYLPYVVASWQHRELSAAADALLETLKATCKIKLLRGGLGNEVPGQTSLSTEKRAFAIEIAQANRRRDAWGKRKERFGSRLAALKQLFMTGIGGAVIVVDASLILLFVLS